MKPDPKRPAKKPEPRGESDRAVRVASQLRQEVARLLGRDLADPRLEGVVVARAWISTDLRLAKVFFRLATTAEGATLEAMKKEASTALEKASGRMRKAVTTRLALRVAPELTFVYDEGQDARVRIESILDEVKRERDARTSGDDEG